MNSFTKAKKEKEIADRWFDGSISEDDAKKERDLSWEMIEYWYGVRYERAAREEARVRYGY